MNKKLYLIYSMLRRTVSEVVKKLFSFNLTLLILFNVGFTIKDASKIIFYLTESIDVSCDVDIDTYSSSKIAFDEYVALNSLYDFEWSMTTYPYDDFGYDLKTFYANVDIDSSVHNYKPRKMSYDNVTKAPIFRAEMLSTRYRYATFSEVLNIDVDFTSNSYTCGYIIVGEILDIQTDVDVNNPTCGYVVISNDIIDINLDYNVSAYNYSVLDLNSDIIDIDINSIIDGKNPSSVAFNNDLSIDFVVSMGMSRYAKLIDYAGNEFTLGSMGNSTLEDLTYIVV